MIKREIQSREDMKILLVNYNEILKNPKSNMKRICDFIASPDVDTQGMVGAIDKHLYRQRR